MTHLDTVRIVPADEKKHRIFCQAPQPFEEGSLSASVFPMFASYGTQSLFGPQQPFSEVKPMGSMYDLFNYTWILLMFMVHV